MGTFLGTSFEMLRMVHVWLTWVAVAAHEHRHDPLNFVNIGDGGNVHRRVEHRYYACRAIAKRRNRVDRTL